MASEDELSSFGVQSMASDGEITWDESAPTDDEFEPSGSFRMPRPETGFTARATAAPRGTIRVHGMPTGKQLDPATTEFVIFAPQVIARSIATTIRTRLSDAKVSYFDGIKPYCLDEEIVDFANLSRVGLLFYSTVGSYDPLADYDQYVQRYSAIPCIALSDKWVDPFCLSAASIKTSSGKSLVKVKASQGDSTQTVSVPIPLNLLEHADLIDPEKSTLTSLYTINKSWLSTKLVPLLMLFLMLFQIVAPKVLWGTGIIAPYLTPESNDNVVNNVVSQTSDFTPTISTTILSESAAPTPTIFNYREFVEQRDRDAAAVQEKPTTVQATNAQVDTWLDPLYGSLNLFISVTRNLLLMVMDGLDRTYKLFIEAAQATAKFSREQLYGAKRVGRKSMGGLKAFSSKGLSSGGDLSRRVSKQMKILNYNVKSRGGTFYKSFMKLQDKTSKAGTEQARKLSTYSNCVWKNRQKGAKALQDCRKPKCNSGWLSF